MEIIKFQVQGSAKEPYEVEFIKMDDKLSTSCTCAAGKKGTYCKHRLNIMNGLTIGAVSQNKGDIEKIRTWLSGTDIEKALIDVTSKEREFEKAKQSLVEAKKKLTRSMRD